MVCALDARPRPEISVERVFESSDVSEIWVAPAFQYCPQPPLWDPGAPREVVDALSAHCVANVSDETSRDIVDVIRSHGNEPCVICLPFAHCRSCFQSLYGVLIHHDATVPDGERGLKGVRMDVKSLDPLPETLVAAMTLRELPSVDADVPVGWAPAALAVASGQLANRPGTRITITKHKGAFKTSFTGGTLVDAEREVLPHPGSWYGGEIAMTSCELCGRPGRRHREPNGVYCDVCHELNAGRTPTFDPRLPLDLYVIEALSELPAIESLPTVPAGWAPLVRSVLKRLGDGTGQDVVFEDHGSHLTVISAPEPDDQVDEVRRILEVLSRERCRYCWRLVEQATETPGECDGCLWVQSRGWTVGSAPADSPGTAEGPL